MANEKFDYRKIQSFDSCFFSSGGLSVLFGSYINTSLAPSYIFQFFKVVLWLLQQVTYCNGLNYSTLTPEGNCTTKPQSQKIFLLQKSFKNQFSPKYRARGW